MAGIEKAKQTAAQAHHRRALGLAALSLRSLALQITHRTGIVSNIRTVLSGSAGLVVPGRRKPSRASEHREELRVVLREPTEEIIGNERRANAGEEGTKTLPENHEEDHEETEDAPVNACDLERAADDMKTLPLLLTTRYV